MLRAPTLMLMAALATGCAAGRSAWEWTGTTEALLIGQAADVATTVWGVESGARELNPLMLDDADDFDYARFAAVKLATVAGLYGLGELYPPAKPWVNRIGFAVGAGAAGWNVYGATR